jgi:phasin
METSVTTKFDIPSTMRDFAENSVEQARKAFEDYLTTAQKAVGTFEASAASAQDSVRAFGADAIAFAEENMAANFDFAKRMIGSRTIEDMVKVQSEFIERQMSAITKQGEKLAASVSKGAAHVAKTAKSNGE